MHNGFWAAVLQTITARVGFTCRQRDRTELEQPEPCPGRARWGRGTGSPAAEMLLRCCSRGLGNLGLCPQSGYSPCPLQTEERAASAFVPGRAAPVGAPGTGKAHLFAGRFAWGWQRWDVGRGRGAAERRSCWGLGALTVRQQQAGVWELVACRILAV